MFPPYVVLPTTEMQCIISVFCSWWRLLRNALMHMLLELLVRRRREDALELVGEVDTCQRDARNDE